MISATPKNISSSAFSLACAYASRPVGRRLSGLLLLQRSRPRALEERAERERSVLFFSLKSSFNEENIFTRNTFLQFFSTITTHTKEFFNVAIFILAELYDALFYLLSCFYHDISTYLWSTLSPGHPTDNVLRHLCNSYQVSNSNHTLSDLSIGIQRVFLRKQHREFQRKQKLLLSATGDLS